MFVVYYNNGSSGYFLYGDGDTPQDYGGTSKFAEAATFETAEMAREMGEAYLRMCRSDPQTSGVVVLRQA